MNRPYNSTRKPTNGQRIKMRMIPTVKAAVPFNFAGREKKVIVFWTPIIRVRPIRKRICEILLVALRPGCDEGTYVAHCETGGELVYSSIAFQGVCMFRGNGRTVIGRRTLGRRQRGIGHLYSIRWLGVSGRGCCADNAAITRVAITNLQSRRRLRFLCNVSAFVRVCL